ncbi:MAG TPA: LacI family transcriptional regulator [Firmicutes bacterium]|nr:LacI family transcriptional regulator [Bacillota bacterium]
MATTISDIAKCANVSKATVSRVINNKSEGVGEETKQKILNIIKEMNYQPSLIARGLVTKRIQSIGLIIPDIANPFFPQLARGAEDAALKRGYNLFLCNSDNSLEKEKNYINAFIKKSVDGVILTSSMSRSNIQCQMLKDSNIPFTLLDRYIEGMEQEAGVFLDNEEGAYRATSYLLKNGHVRIVFISGPFSVTTAWQRFQGFQKAHFDRGVPIDYQLIREGEYHLESGRKFVEQLLTDNIPFSAVFAGNDMIAIGALKALKKQHIKVPASVEIIGFDNIDLSALIEPALSTVAQPTYDMGALGAEMLIDLIEGQELQQNNIYLKPELIFRETTRQ